MFHLRVDERIFESSSGLTITRDRDESEIRVKKCEKNYRKEEEEKVETSYVTGLHAFPIPLKMITSPPAPGSCPYDLSCFL